MGGEGKGKVEVGWGGGRDRWERKGQVGREGKDESILGNISSLNRERVLSLPNSDHICSTLCLVSASILR